MIRQDTATVNEILIYQSFVA